MIHSTNSDADLNTKFLDISGRMLTYGNPTLAVQLNYDTNPCGMSNGGVAMTVSTIHNVIKLNIKVCQRS
ncbi:unnamed protein product [Clavelina lepadiformis]|uniref:Uncharacterized protein n=1 Tax=Clavelina lepadiformis TaxID=159417 RepID=A0ABP0G0V8_CLALP